ncbi:MAG: pyrroline-5-carboxylate reductase [Cyanothece sp. SIO1E1]|nr:pyrroline-5-carboxylate reductase [Cyanothece sp. SIO1E1]
MSIKLSVIGGGVMGEALLSRLIYQQIYAPTEILVSDPLPSRRDFLAQSYGVQVTNENRDALVATEILLLAIKPQIFDPVTADLVTLEQSPLPLIASILAGISLAKLELAFPEIPIIRAMPNTPATVGAGVTAIAPGQYAKPMHMTLAKQMFEAVGTVVEVPERLMDAVTGLSGSGPGYIAIVIEALTDGGVAAGLPRAIAQQLALQTVRGTAELLHESGLHPATLKDQVTSPGGTTIAGIACLEKAGLRTALIEAVRTACQRSQELGE